VNGVAAAARARVPPLAAALDIAAAVLLGVAATAAFAGPMRLDVGGTTISVRTVARPLVAAAIVTAFRLWLARREPVALPAIAGRVLLGAVSIASVLSWTIFLSPTVGGADSWGYVGAAERILAGRLVQPEPLSALLPFDNAITAAAPLGTAPSARVAHASVPAYPLGLPLLMAAAQRIAGPAAPFWIAPLAGLLLIVATATLARVWYDDGTTTLTAAALVAANPLVFTYAIQPMSDVPATVLLLAAIVLLSTARARPILAGTCAALALLVRPALAPAAMAVPLIVEWSRDHRGRSARLPRSRTDVRLLLFYLLPLIAGVAVLAWTQWYLYGNALRAGYGPVADLFTWRVAIVNLSIFGRWLVPTLGAAWIAAVVLGTAVSGRPPRRALVVMAIAVGAPYVFYRPYDHWETLRFLLPIIALSTPLAAAGLLAATRRMPGTALPTLAAALVVAAMTWGWTKWLAVNQVFTMPSHEARHRLAGEMVAQTTPDSAVIIALQHSGSVRYYSGRQTLRWTGIPAGSLDAAVQALRSRGYPVYVMIDSDAERTLFVEQHGRVLDQWLPAGQRRSVQLFEAR
jgi:hypothetical protein